MIYDLHNDILTSTVDIEKIDAILCNYEQNNNICKTNLAIWTTEGNYNINKIKNIYERLDLVNRDKFILSIEDIGFVSEEEIIELIQLPAIVYSMTWNYENKFGCGALDTGGITELGKKIH